MRTVKGRTDRVVVVGAGLSGLAGRCSWPGAAAGSPSSNGTITPAAGRACGHLRLPGGHRADGVDHAGIIDEAFAAVGETLAGRLELRRCIRPIRRCSPTATPSSAHRTDGDDARSTVRRAGEADATAVAGLADQAVPDQIRRLHRHELRLAAVALTHTGPLAALGGFRRWERVMRRFLTDQRLLRVFTFQALYAGVPPQSALAAYAVIAYMDTMAGVWFPRGGMHALPDGMAAAAADAGVEFIFDSTVSELGLERSGTGVCTGGRRSGSAATRWCSPASFRTRTTAGPRTSPAAGVAALAVGRRGPRGGRAAGPASPTTPSVRRGLGADIPRDHRRWAGDGQTHRC